MLEREMLVREEWRVVTSVLQSCIVIICLKIDVLLVQ